MQNKIVNREEAQQIVNDKRTAGCCIGFTSGVFDIVHAGHVDYLEQARAKCDFLVVAVNSDQRLDSTKTKVVQLILQRTALRLLPPYPQSTWFMCLKNDAISTISKL